MDHEKNISDGVRHDGRDREHSDDPGHHHLHSAEPLPGAAAQDRPGDRAGAGWNIVIMILIVDNIRLLLSDVR